LSTSVAPSGPAAGSAAPSPGAGPPGRRLAVNLTVLAGSQVVTWSVSLLWQVLVPRILGPYGIGLIVTGSASVGILAVVLGAGTRPYLVREMTSHPDDVPRLAGAAILVRLLLAVLALAIVAVYVRALPFGPDQVKVFYLYTGATVLTLLAEPIQAAFQSRQRMEYLAYGDIFTNVLYSLVAIALAIAGFGAVVLSAWWLVTCLAVLSLFLIWRSRSGRVDLRPGMAIVRRVLRGSFVYWATGLFFTIYLYIDSAMLADLAPPWVVGWYGVSTKLFTTLMFFPVIVSTAWLPALVEAFNRDRASLISAARQPTALVLIVGLPVAAGTVMVAPQLVHLLYGPSFAQATPPLAILALAIPAMYLNIMFNQVLVACNRQAVWTKALAGATVLNPLLNLFLIRYFQNQYHNGAMGAAWSLVLTEIAIAAYGLLQIRDLIDGALLVRLAKAVGATAGMTGVLYLMGDRLLLIEVPVAVATFTALVVLLRVLIESERRWLWDRTRAVLASVRARVPRAPRR
jgi:O-antigen/teichoic acid export membrane protein